ncbi:MAG TPA: hypothetical protein VML91_16660 [Burkholderiales bacterium]|nr:hypothetical protein [Burkholderiales bacterium]
MRRSSAAFVAVVFLLGTIASVDAFARGGGHGGHGGHGGRGHGSGQAHFHGGAPRSAVIVTAPVFFGGFRSPYYYPPAYAYPAAPYYSAGPYYSGTPYYPEAPYYPSGPYDSAPYSPPEYIEQGQDQPPPPPQPGPPQQPGPQQQPAPAYMWFCPSANNYYPYVTTCSSGWRPVAPLPPPS